MTLETLENLVKIGKLKKEPADQKEFDRMLNSARRGINDAKVKGISEDGQFSFVYGAAHALALAALRWHGYRSDNRYLVFQCLEQTTGLENAKWRVLDKCHQLRNHAEYEGLLEITPQLHQELVDITEELLQLVSHFDPVQ